MRSGFPVRTFVLAIALAALIVKLGFDCPPCWTGGNGGAQAEGGRYVAGVDALYAAWSSPNEVAQGPGGYLRYVSLYLPISPQGEKPIFLFAGAIVKAVLSAVAPSQAQKPLLWLNILSFAAIIVLLAYLLFEHSAVAALASVGVLLGTYDFWQLTYAGYHTIFGLAVLLGGVAIARDYSAYRRSALGGAVIALSIFASPHMALPAIAIGIVALAPAAWRSSFRTRKKLWNLAYAALGVAGIVALTYVTYAIHSRLGLPASSAVSTILLESNQASHFGGMLPVDYFFFFDYAAFQLGLPLLTVLGIGWVLAVLMPGRSFARRVFPWATVLSILVIGYLNLPTIGRVQLPNVVLFVASACLGWASLLATLDWRVRFGSSAVLLVGLAGLAFARAETLQHGEPATVGRLEQAITTYVGKPIVESVIVSDDQLGRLDEVIQGKILRVDMRSRVLHSDYQNCGFELLLADLEKSGLKPLAVTPATLDRRLCFLNEFAYRGFCKGDWRAAYPNRIALQERFNPGWYYYFDGGDVIRTMQAAPPADLAAYRCYAAYNYAGPQVLQFVGPKK